MTSSSGSTTAPVGFEGLFTTTARVFGVIALATARAVTRKPFFSVERDEDGGAAGHPRGLGERRPGRDRDDDLAAPVENGLVEEGERLLAAHRDRDLLGREGDLKSSR